jgi:hypothetical protein
MKQHQELINTTQTKRTNKDWWDDKPSVWDERKKSAWKDGLLESVKVSDGEYFKIKISEKGELVLKQCI